MPVIPLKKLVPGVEENSDFLVFYVESSNPGREPYRVDLQRHNSNGFCDCPSFAFKKQKALAKGAYPAENLECKHIRRAKRYLLFKVLNEIITRREIESHENRTKAKASRAVGNGVSTATPKADQPVSEPPPEPTEWQGGERSQADDDPDCPF